MDNFTVEEVRDWQNLPLTKWLVSQIIKLRVNATESVFAGIRNERIDTASRYMGERDAYAKVLELPDDLIELIKEQKS